MEITNPRKLLFDKKDLGEISIARNPIILDLAHRLRYVEKIGSGIKRIRNLVPDVKFEIGSNWFRVIFKRNVRFPEKFPEKNPDKILYLIKNNPQITIKQIGGILRISDRAVKK